MQAIFRNIKSLLFFPLLILPVGTLLYGIGVVLATPQLIGTSIFTTTLAFVPSVLRQMGYIIQEQTGLLAAISVTLGLSRKSITATLTTIFTYYVMQASFDKIAPLILPKELFQELSNMPLTIYPFYLVGGVVLAVVVSRVLLRDQSDKAKLFMLREQFKKAFYAVVVGSVIAVALAFVWVYIIRFLSLAQPYFTGITGTSLYGLMMVVLKPFGLSTLFETLQNFTYLGGGWRSAALLNVNVYGYENIWLAQLTYNNGNFTGGLFPALRYMNALFIIPAASLAIFHTSYVEHKAMVKKILLLFGSISLLVGITLPIEIILLFTSPLLFLIIGIMNAIVGALLYIINTGVGIHVISVSGGGLFDFLFFGIIPGAEKTGVWVLLLLGIGVSVITYYMTYWSIKFFKLSVFGRNKEELQVFAHMDGYEADQPLGSSTPMEGDKIGNLIKALGNYDNIINIYTSMYRLHVEVKQTDLVDVLMIKYNGAAGVFIVQSTIQIIFGATTHEYYEEIQKKIAENQ